jgi:hypothetical protein
MFTGLKQKEYRKSGRALELLTILTTLLHNKQIPDPFFGMNNNLIPDVYESEYLRKTFEKKETRVSVRARFEENRTRV